MSDPIGYGGGYVGDVADQRRARDGAGASLPAAGKRKAKATCEHGGSAVSISGCPDCVVASMHGGRLLRMLGLEASQVMTIVWAYARAGESPKQCAARAAADMAGREAAAAKPEVQA